MKKFIFCFTALIGSLTAGIAQKNPFTLEDIFLKGTFRTAGISGFNVMNDGLHYTELVSESNGWPKPGTPPPRWRIIKRKLWTGDSAGVILKSTETAVDMMPQELTILLYHQMRNS